MGSTHIRVDRYLVYTYLVDNLASCYKKPLQRWTKLVNKFMSDVELFNDSYDRVMKDEDAFFALFYKIFTNSSDKIAKLFESIDMAAQAEMLKSSLVFVMSFSSTDKASPYLKNLATLHKDKLKISSGLYTNWLVALIETAEIIDGKFNKETAEAWKTTFTPGIEFMQDPK